MYVGPSGEDRERGGSIPISALNLTSHLCVRTSEGRISEFWFGLRPLPGPDGPTYIFGYTTWERDPSWPAFLHGHPVPNP